MTNLEKMIGELKMSEHWSHQCCRDVYKFKNREECQSYSRCDCCEFDITINILEYLNKEYEPPIELTQLEYDLLKVATKHKEYSVNDRLHVYEYINILASNGYFKDVNLALTIKEVLDRAVIVDDE